MRISDFLLQGLAVTHNQTRHAELLKTTPLNTPLYSSFLCLSIFVVTWSIIKRQADVILLCSCSLCCFFLNFPLICSLSSWSFYFFWMNQHLHSLACVTDVYLKIIDVETHSWLEPAAAKLGRADKYISNINGSLWRCCLRGRTLGPSLPPQTHIVPSVKVCVISEGVIGLWPWLFSVVYGFLFCSPYYHRLWSNFLFMWMFVFGLQCFISRTLKLAHSSGTSHFQVWSERFSLHLCIVSAEAMDGRTTPRWSWITSRMYSSRFANTSKWL